MIMLKFNIQQSSRLQIFFGMYYEWGCEEKDSYAKMTMEKDVEKLVEVNEKYTGRDVKVQTTSGAPGMTLSKIEL